MGAFAPDNVTAHFDTLRLVWYNTQKGVNIAKDFNDFLKDAEPYKAYLASIKIADEIDAKDSTLGGNPKPIQHEFRNIMGATLALLEQYHAWLRDNA